MIDAESDALFSEARREEGPPGVGSQTSDRDSKPDVVRYGIAQEPYGGACAVVTADVREQLIPTIVHRHICVATQYINVKHLIQAC